MRTNLMSRADAVKIVGEKAVTDVEGENCEYTNRVLETHGIVEFAASIRCKTLDGEQVTLTAYYYQDDLDDVEDLGSLYWEVEGFEIT